MGNLRTLYVGDAQQQHAVDALRAAAVFELALTFQGGELLKR